MRCAIYIASLLAALPVWAEDFMTLALVTQATIYPSGATVLREFEADLPQGSHRILIPVVARDISDGPPRISGGAGVVLGSVELLPDFVTDAELVYTAAQREAFAELEAAEARVEEQRDTVEQLQNAVTAAEAETAFYRSLSAASLEELDPDALRAAGQLVASELARVLEAARVAKLSVRDAQETLEQLQAAAVQVARDFELLSPPEGPVDVIAVTVELDAPVRAQMQLEQLIAAARWSAEYELDLNTEGDPVVAMTRKIVVSQSTRELWSDVALTLSTANPFAQLNPNEPQPNLAAIAQNIARRSAEYSTAVTSLDAARDEGAVILEEGARVRVAGVVIDGLSVTYDYPQPVTLTPGGGQLILSLDRLSFEAERSMRAAPRFDETAFLIANFENSRAEPLLPGIASIHRDGVFIGRTGFELVPAGGEAELSFGALEGIRLSYDLLENDTGDRGLISTSSTRTQSMEYTVENLTSSAVTVETIFALPFSEQDSLSVSVRAKPAPDEVDFDKRRSVGLWKLDLAPGQSETVRIDADLSWPEGQTLIWQP